MIKYKTPLLTLAGISLLGASVYGFNRPMPFWPDMFDDGPAMPALRCQVQAPALDFSQNDKAYTISIELPGMDKKDVSVTIRSGVLTISGKKQAAKEDKDTTYRIRESRFGEFSRSVSLPDDADPNAVSAKFDKGILTVTIQRNAKLKPQQVQID